MIGIKSSVFKQQRFLARWAQILPALLMAILPASVFAQSPFAYGQAGSVDPNVIQSTSTKIETTAAATQSVTTAPPIPSNIQELLGAGCSGENSIVFRSVTAMSTSIIGHPNASLNRTGRYGSFNHELFSFKSSVSDAPFYDMIGISGDYFSPRKILPLFTGSGPDFGAAGIGTLSGTPAPGGGKFTAFRMVDSSAISGNFLFLAQRGFNGVKKTGLYVFLAQYNSISKLLEIGDTFGQQSIVSIGAGTLTDEVVPRIAFFAATTFRTNGFPIPRLFAFDGTQTKLILSPGDTLPDNSKLEALSANSEQYNNSIWVHDAPPQIDNSGKIYYAAATDSAIGGGFFMHDLAAPTNSALLVPQGLITTDGYKLNLSFDRPTVEKRTGLLFFSSFHVTNNQPKVSYFVRFPNGSVLRAFGSGDLFTVLDTNGSPTTKEVKGLVSSGISGFASIDECANVIAMVGFGPTWNPDPAVLVYHHLNNRSVEPMLWEGMTLPGTVDTELQGLSLAEIDVTADGSAAVGGSDSSNFGAWYQLSRE
ncbi:MAG: hypothetical protein KDD70_08655 [Bdellovibrionales bacterium]|nr:hypothetical protein [Bdellovibrionales bacterium]